MNLRSASEHGWFLEEEQCIDFLRVVRACLGRRRRVGFGQGGRMRPRFVRFLVVFAAVGCAALPARSGGPAPRASLEQSTDRLIVKLRDPAEVLQPAKLGDLSRASGVALSVLRRTADGAYVLRTRDMLARALADVLAERLHFRPDVMYAEAD